MLAEKCIAMAADDLANRKLFVRGLPWGTADEGLKAAFAEYGEITEGGVAIDRMTGKSRGFGFITFLTAAAAQAALREPTKLIDGRQTMCNLASAGAHARPSGGGRGQGAVMGVMGGMGGMVAMGGMGGMGGMDGMGYSGGRGGGGGYSRGGGAGSPRGMPPNSMGAVGVSGMPASYYLSSMYQGYSPSMMPPPSGYDNMGR
ncbi:hypothetical protein T492DRAFT_984626 [Pavlovales sp. CCMP2436]|nr:hypothetical protein T492DRAFT_984626 [Pavlovales sp. CCMP2436]